MSDADRRARIWPGPKYMQREDAVSVRLSGIQLSMRRQMVKQSFTTRVSTYLDGYHRPYD